MRKENKYLLFGRHPIVEAIKDGTPFEKVWLQQGTRGEFEKEIRGLCKTYEIPMQVVPKEKLAKMVKGNHQGVVAHIALISYSDLENLLPLIYERSETPLILVLDGITDVRNLGAIARSAECLGAHALVVPQKGGALVNAEALKTSAGALTKIPVCREKSLVNAVQFLKQSGLQVVAASLDARKTLVEIDFTVPLVLILGSEDKGVRSSLLEESDELCYIPQSGETESLNVSVSAGILLYEVQRSRSD